MDYCVIDGKAFDVTVLNIEENFNILDGENAGRVIKRGRMEFDTIGTFVGHKVTFERKGINVKEYDQLWDLCKNPNKRAHMVTMADGQSTISYEAYCQNGTRPLVRIDENIYWGELTINFIPVEAQEVPSE